MAETVLKSIFPDKAKFEESKTKYIEANYQNNFDYLKNELPDESEETVKLVATGITRALHAAQTFVDAVPAHLLEGPHQLTIGWTTLQNERIGGISNGVLKVDGRENLTIQDVSLEELARAEVTDVYATVNLTSILHDVKFIQRMQKQDYDYLTKITDDEEKKEAEEIFAENFVSRTEQSFQQAEIDMIHELGHALDHIQANKNKRRLIAWKEHAARELGADVNDRYGSMTEVKWQEYQKSKAEVGAKRWERYYKRNYYS